MSGDSPADDEDTPEDAEKALDTPDDIEVDVDTVEEGDMAPREVERVFSLLEAATAEDALEGRSLRRLLSVLENALDRP